MRFEPSILDALRTARVIPVVTVADAAQALGIAEALRAGGLNLIEITLRTDGALAAIGTLKKGYPDLCVGAGTVRSRDDLARAESAGADFVVTPGMTPNLLDALVASKISAIPGAQTSSEVMALSEAGFEVVKFFPSEACGGVDALKALAGPLPEVQFVPTGGIGPLLVPDYLALSNVLAVGGSWVAPTKMIEAGDWAGIEENAKRVGELWRRS